MRSVQTQRLDEPSETIGVAGDSERFRRVGRSASAGSIPRHHGELIREFLDLRLPGRLSVTYVTVQQEKRWPCASAFIRDTESFAVNRLHDSSRRHDALNDDLVRTRGCCP